ncbi:aminotransferase [Corynebacterium sp. sy017]|uniref:aminotransferase n=1 Tax=unclassified Corynebacterium TaxID=2624378 RepID=UPI00118727BE|nr:MULTISPECIES: aminotransferase [unclassified Corynebacterium]MBP3089344.1 aminotransferase [Corynebacterium sp. sy017]TSD90958.1 aminotransferase [Corynebacterium sp. SY003]
MGNNSADTTIIAIIADPLIDAAQTKELVAAALTNDMGVCVEANMLTATHAAQEKGTVVGAWVGYPTGKHHSLVKAAEARLAVQYGATHLVVVLDQAIVQRQDNSALMSELISLREAIPAPAHLGVVVETTMLEIAQTKNAAVQAAACGIDFLLTGTQSTAPEHIAELMALSAQGALGTMRIYAVSNLGAAADYAQYAPHGYWVYD